MASMTYVWWSPNSRTGRDDGAADHAGREAEAAALQHPDRLPRIFVTPSQ